GIAGQPVEGPVPAVATVGDELLDDAEGGVGGAPFVLVPTEQPGDLVEAVAVQEAEHLELRVHPGLDPAVDLQDRVLAENDRAVRLLGGDRADLPAGRWWRGALGPGEDDAPLGRGGLAAGDDQVEQPR